MTTPPLPRRVRLVLPEPEARYRSHSQRARVATESWAEENLYCPKCQAPKLGRHPASMRVSDFACSRCDLQLQLKAKNGAFGASFVNSAYAPKVEAIRARRLPDYALLSYDRDDWRVTDLRIVPGHFIPETAVAARNPLKASARRAGWVGSVVRLGFLPPDAFVPVVVASRPRPPERVRDDYRRFGFLREQKSGSVGWFADVLAQVRRIAPSPGATFSLVDLYEAAEEELARLHPQNRNVRPKIRQQLQALRDHGILAFVRPGVYRMLP